MTVACSTTLLYSKVLTGGRAKLAHCYQTANNDKMKAFHLSIYCLPRLLLLLRRAAVEPAHSCCLRATTVTSICYDDMLLVTAKAAKTPPFWRTGPRGIGGGVDSSDTFIDRKMNSIYRCKLCGALVARILTTSFLMLLNEHLISNSLLRSHWRHMDSVGIQSIIVGINGIRPDFSCVNCQHASSKLRVEAGQRSFKSCPGSVGWSKNFLLAGGISCLSHLEPLPASLHAEELNHLCFIGLWYLDCLIQIF